MDIYSNQKVYNAPAYIAPVYLVQLNQPGLGLMNLGTNIASLELK